MGAIQATNDASVSDELRQESSWDWITAAEAFGRLRQIAKHYHAKYELRKLGREADDLLNDALIKWLSKEHPPPPQPEQGSNWEIPFRRNCIDVACNLLKKNKRRIKREERYARCHAESGPAPSSQIELAGFVRWLLEQLPKDDRKILVLHVANGLPFEEVGQRLGLSAAAARKHYQRAKERLRDSLQKHGLL